MSSIYDWSPTADRNANADSIINWEEGQKPSTVNDSARAMMQRIREYISDQGGIAISTGTAQKITLNAHSPVTTYIDGISIRFRAAFTNQADTTLNLNRGGEKKLYKADTSGAQTLKGGEIQTGCLYEVVYNESLDNGKGGWFLMNATPLQQQPAIPPGYIGHFAMPYTPSGWLPCDGRSYSRFEYSALFNAIGTIWGQGPGNFFKVPDFRGIFLRGWDNNRGIDPGRNFGTYQESANKTHTHIISIKKGGEHRHYLPYSGAVRTGNGPYTTVNSEGTPHDSTGFAGEHTHEATAQADGINESRPGNYNCLFAIKA
ncbi:phage tail protein [Bartonella sp. DGB2]|uniref:phage tail protein n=1 Tax=Bartonella sp. DGB2 TaxID=3388426 RepID=UPI00398FCD29